MTNRLLRLLLLLLAIGVLGCSPTPQDLADGDDPLAALRSPARSARYDGTFWSREAEAGSALWQGAIDYCRSPGNSTLPNCQTVGLVLSTLELERAAEDAKRKLEILLREGESLSRLPRLPPVPPGGGR